MELGASDFIEKPSLSNLAQKTDEIRTKLSCVAKAKRADLAEAQKLAQSFKKVVKIQSPEKKVRLVFAGISDAKAAVHICKQVCAPFPPTVIMVSDENLVPAMQKALEKEGLRGTKALEAGKELAANQVYVAGCDKQLSDVESRKQGKLTSVIVLGALSGTVASRVARWMGVQMILEDIGDTSSNTYKTIKPSAQFYVPYASIAYHSDEHFAKN